MPAGHIVISMDSHTEGIIDLKPYLPTKYHEAFDVGTAIAKDTFSKGVGFFYNMVEAAGGESFGSGEASLYELPEMERFHHGNLEATIDEYLRPWPIAERIAAIDADGVAAEFITPF